MKEICAPVPTNESLLKKRTKEECKECKHTIYKFLIEIILSLVYAYLTTNIKYLRSIYISETVSFSNDISFPFQDLLLIIESKFKVITRIKYNNYEEIILN